MKGITVTLVKKSAGSADPFGEPVYTETTENVDDVLVGEPSTDDINNNLSLYGKRVAYTLAIPKGDSHIWEDTKVILPSPFEGEYRTIGYPTAGIEANIPLRWNKKVHLERIQSEV